MHCVMDQLSTIQSRKSVTVLIHKFSFFTFFKVDDHKDNLDKVFKFQLQSMSNP